jgi:hypothetical protein
MSLKTRIYDFLHKSIVLVLAGSTIAGGFLLGREVTKIRGKRHMAKVRPSWTLLDPPRHS